MITFDFYNLCSENAAKPLRQSSEEERRELAKSIAADLSAQTGLNITTDAVLWQLENWMWDYKSGYRDEENGYHLFSACSCNPFNIQVTTLSPEANCQSTYWA